MDLPLIVALFTFLAIVLGSSAVFFYFNSREAVQTWRRRADGTSATADSEADPESIIDELKAQLQAVLEWFGKLNQPSNVEEARATRRKLINAGYRSGKASVFFLGAKLFLAVVIVCAAYTDSGKSSGISQRFTIDIFLCPGCRMWLLCSSAMAQKGDCASEGCAPTGYSGCLGSDGGLRRSRFRSGSGDWSSWRRGEAYPS